MSHPNTSAFPHVEHHHMEMLQLCLTVCSSCAKMCLDEGRKDSAALCLDCADICALTIQLHSRESEFSPALMQLCSQACLRCGQECGKVKVDHCQQCSEICNECARVCNE